MAKKEKNDTRYKISKELYKKWQQIFYKEETRDYAVKYALTYIKNPHANQHHLVEGHVSSSDGCSYIIIEKAVKTI